MRMIFVVCLSLASIAPALAQGTVYRDKKGDFIGTSGPESGRIVNRDKYGNRTGSYGQEGGQTVFRDKYGDRLESASPKH